MPAMVSRAALDLSWIFLWLVLLAIGAMALRRFLRIRRGAIADLLRRPALLRIASDGTFRIRALWLAWLARALRRRSTSAFLRPAWLLLLIDPDDPNADRLAEIYLRAALRAGPPVLVCAAPGVSFESRALPADVPVVIRLADPEAARSTLAGLGYGDLALPLLVIWPLGAETIDGARMTWADAQASVQYVLRARAIADAIDADPEIRERADRYVARRTIDDRDLDPEIILRYMEALVAGVDRVDTGDASARSSEEAVPIVRCDSCDRTRPTGVVESWMWIWSSLAGRALCFCPVCAAKLSPPSEDVRPIS